MLNEERIILMTRMAAYEKDEGKKNIAIGKYFRSDYIAIQMLKSLVSITVAYLIVVALFILYDFEVFMQNIYQMDLIAFAKNILMYYGITVVVYSVVCYGIFAYRYSKAKKSLKYYYQNLKKLNSFYQE